MANEEPCSQLHDNWYVNPGSLVPLSLLCHRPRAKLLYNGLGKILSVSIKMRELELQGEWLKELGDIMDRTLGRGQDP